MRCLILALSIAKERLLYNAAISACSLMIAEVITEGAPSVSWPSEVLPKEVFRWDKRTDHPSSDTLGAIFILSLEWSNIILKLSQERWAASEESLHIASYFMPPCHQRPYLSFLIHEHLHFRQVWLISILIDKTMNITTAESRIDGLHSLFNAKRLLRILSLPEQDQFLPLPTILDPRLASLP